MENEKGKCSGCSGDGAELKPAVDGNSNSFVSEDMSSVVHVSRAERLANFRLRDDLLASVKKTVAQREETISVSRPTAIDFILVPERNVGVFDHAPFPAEGDRSHEVLSGPHFVWDSLVLDGPLGGLSLGELGVVPIDPNTPIKDERKDEEEAAAGTVERRNADGKKIRDDDRRTVVFKKKYKKDQRCWYEQYFFSKVYAYKDNPRPDPKSPPDESKRIKSADDPSKPVLVGGKGQVKPGESGKTGKPWKNDTDDISEPNSDAPIGSQSFPNPTKTKPDEDSGEGTIKMSDHPKFVEDTKNIYEGWNRDKWDDKDKKGRTNAERSGVNTAPKWFEWVLDFYTYFICNDEEVSAWYWQLRVLMHVKDANTIEEDWSDVKGPEKTDKTREDIHGRKDYPRDPPNPKDTTTGK